MASSKIVENCNFVKSSECHKLSYNRLCGLINFTDLTDIEKELVILRSGIQVENEASAVICFHHKKIFLDRFESQQTSCFDPLQQHKKHAKSALRTLTVEESKELSTKLKRRVIPGWKLCSRCYESVFSSEKVDQFADDDAEFVPAEAHRYSINISAKQLGVSPLKVAKLGTKEKVSYGKRKIAQFTTATVQKVAGSLEVSESDLSEHQQSKEECPKCQDMDTLVAELKTKLSVSSRKEKLQLLTLAPQSWTVQKCIEEFGISRYLVQTYKKLRKEHGILPDIGSHGAHPVDENTIQCVEAFYRDDIVSRILPGAKDYVSVRVGDKKEHRQKRLILMNLNELHVLFKQKYPETKIGLSKFCQLRPKECITVGARGTHSVCVCTQHQNVKLMLFALPVKEKVTYHDLMDKMVCSVESKECMLHRCNSCPGKDGLMLYLQQLTDAADDSDLVHYKQWESTDRTTMVERARCTGSWRLS